MRKPLPVPGPCAGSVANIVTDNDAKCGDEKERPAHARAFLSSRRVDAYCIGFLAGGRPSAPAGPGRVDPVVARSALLCFSAKVMNDGAFLSSSLVIDSMTLSTLPLSFLVTFSSLN